MTSWTNDALTAFHGTDTSTLSNFAGMKKGELLSGFKVDLGKCRDYTDFGKGFYVTTSLIQARVWANARAERRGKVKAKAIVLAFKIDRDWLSSLESLSFVRPDRDFMRLVKYCRKEGLPHNRAGTKLIYDVVYGPVSLWPKWLTVNDADQISFHSESACSDLPEPSVFEIAEAEDGLLAEDV